MDLKIGLSVSQGGIGQGVYLGHGWIGHGITANGSAASVHHQGAAGSAVDAIISIGVPQIKGQKIFAVWLHLVWKYCVESFRRAPVTAPGFGHDALPPVGANRIAPEPDKAVVFIQPDL